MTVELSCLYGKRLKMFYDVTEVQHFITDVPYFIICQGKHKTSIMEIDIVEIVIKE